MAASSAFSISRVALLASRLLGGCCNSMTCISQVRYATRLKQPSVAKVKEKLVRSTKEDKKIRQCGPPSNSPFWLKRAEDDVWVRMYYPRPLYTLDETIRMHRELAQPAMMNNPDGMLYVDLTLCMKTKKKTKFTSGITKTLVLPYPFPFGARNRIVMFCNSAEEQQKAIAVGATYAGGADLVGKFVHSEIVPADYDVVLCTLDTVHELIPLRTILKDSFPNKNRGTLGSNIADLMNTYINGITYKSVKDKEQDASVATMQVPLGKLNMEESHLKANLKAYVDSVGTFRSADLGPVILKASCTCPPSSEKFFLAGRDIGHIEKPGSVLLSLKPDEDDDQESVKSDDESDGE